MVVQAVGRRLTFPYPRCSVEILGARVARGATEGGSGDADGSGVGKVGVGKFQMADVNDDEGEPADVNGLEDVVTKTCVYGHS